MEIVPLNRNNLPPKLLQKDTSIRSKTNCILLRVIIEKNRRRKLRDYLILFIIMMPLMATDINGNELPIGLAEEEKVKMHIIQEMGRETDPPPTPIRNIAEFEPMQGVLIRYPFGISTSIIKEMAEDVTVYCLVSSSSQGSAFNSMKRIAFTALNGFVLNIFNG